VGVKGHMNVNILFAVEDVSFCMSCSWADGCDPTIIVKYLKPKTKYFAKKNPNIQKSYCRNIWDGTIINNDRNIGDIILCLVYDI